MRDIFGESVDPSRDQPRTRKAGVDDKNDFVFKQTDPYGFWYISRERGQVPDKLSGAYTKIELARNAVALYAREELEAVREIEAQRNLPNRDVSRRVSRSDTAAGEPLAGSSAVS